MVKDIARTHCLEVEVVDVAKENVLRRVIQKEREKIRTFPALIAGDGQKIEGEMTEKQVESFLSRIVDEARKRYL
jgi:pheromone shutdown protein TraB